MDNKYVRGDLLRLGNHPSDCPQKLPLQTYLYLIGSDQEILFIYNTVENGVIIIQQSVGPNH